MEIHRISICGGAFSNCTSLEEIEIPNSVTYIGKMAFSSCSSLSQIVIPDSVTYIGRNAFSGCTSLTEITIPSSVQTVEETVFYSCSNLERIYVPFKEGEKPAGWSNYWSDCIYSSKLEIVYIQETT